MFYDKQIRYLEYLENGEKIRSAGFVKIEVIDKVCNIQISVTGLHPSESCTREVHLLGMQDQGVLGSITFLSGKGSLGCRHIPADKLCEKIGYEELRSIRISLGKNRELVCRWREDERQIDLSKSIEQSKQIPQSKPIEQSGPVEQEEAVKPTESQVIAAEETFLSSIERSGSESPVTKPSVLESPETEPPSEPPSEQPSESPSEPSSEPPSEPQRPTGPSMPPRHSEDKWKQLADIYPHISPFHDERDYLSIGPNDFVVLPKKHYRLISNSFLLHGFYNYGHLILARTVKRGEEMFYLGVPGNFFEREKQVAIMFGFESFECKKEPAMDGDFGYFMIKIEL